MPKLDENDVAADCETKKKKKRETVEVAESLADVEIKAPQKHKSKKKPAREVLAEEEVDVPKKKKHKKALEKIAAEGEVPL